MVKILVSIHPMLLFNMWCRWRYLYIRKFQYIPCYCSTLRCWLSFHLCTVSIHPMLLFNSGSTVDEMIISCFNTSHVTVQLSWINHCHTSSTKFQYIPCYCSTKAKIIQRIEGELFQYIPCYCSTKTAYHGNFFAVSFNTSHVTVQPNVKFKFSSKLFSFNTSHVTVQRHENVIFKMFISVSIHPMLLFNS